jgi:hypothetical protein
MVPKPVTAMIPRISRPTILPNAANVAFFQPNIVEFVIMKRTAGPGVAVAANTNVRYMNHN